MLPTEIGMEYLSFLYEFHFPEPVLRYPSPPPFLLLFLPSSLSPPPFPAVTRHLSLHYTREKRQTDRQTETETEREALYVWLTWSVIVSVVRSRHVHQANHLFELKSTDLHDESTNCVKYVFV